MSKATPIRNTAEEAFGRIDARMGFMLHEGIVTDAAARAALEAARIHVNRALLIERKRNGLPVIVPPDPNPFASLDSTERVWLYGLLAKAIQEQIRLDTNSIYLEDLLRFQNIAPQPSWKDPRENLLKHRAWLLRMDELIARLRGEALQADAEEFGKAAADYLKSKSQEAKA